MDMTWAGRRARTRLAVAGVTLGALVAAAPAGSASILGGQTAASGPVTGTANGPVRGVANGAVNEFLGIPFAAPPVGELRWRPPQPVAPWHGVRSATALPNVCAQLPSTNGPGSSAEDCLYLSVYRPVRLLPLLQRPLPVLVWIHGGGGVN